VEVKNIIFIGGLFPKEKENEIYKNSKGNIQYAANNLQWNLIKGFDNVFGKKIKIINEMFVGSFPKLYKKIRIKSFDFSHAPNNTDKNVGFINILGIKNIFRALNLKKELIKTAKEPINIIIIYSMHTPFIYAAAKVKKMYPNIHLCLIVPDLPQYMNLSKSNNAIFNFFKYCDIYFMYKYLYAVDSFVLLTEYMKDKLPIENKPYTVIEGMVDINAERIKEYKSNNVILYTGTLNRSYGIITLLEAFEMLQNEDYRLWICGSGEAETEIRELEKKDKRIKFFGLLQPKKIKELQCSAKALINPRNSSDEFTKYSFPSKNMEYLLSGRPLIAYKLQGIPDEYDKHIFYIKGNTALDMAYTINKILKTDEHELFVFGEKAKEFVLKEKNNIKQAGKIIELINEN
jgi:hypothetical protein